MFPGSRRPPRGTGSRCPRGAAVQANFAARLCRAPCGSASRTLSFALTWPSQERTEVGGVGGPAAPPPTPSSPARGAPPLPLPLLTGLARDGRWRGVDRSGFPGGLWVWSKRQWPGALPRAAALSSVMAARRLCYPEECDPRWWGWGPARRPRAPGHPGQGGAGLDGGPGAGGGGGSSGGAGRLCSIPPPVPTARGSAILASGAWRHGGRHHHRGRCWLGSAPPEHCCYRCPRPGTSPWEGNSVFQGHFLSSRSF